MENKTELGTNLNFFDKVKNFVDFEKIKMHEQFEEYRRTLFDQLADASTNFRGLNDFKIVCEDGTEFHTFRLLLAAKSKYFDALFRHEPEKRILNLPYEGHIMKIIMDSHLETEEFDKRIDDFFKVYEAADYFQIETIVKALQDYVFYRCFDYGLNRRRDRQNTINDFYQFAHFFEKYEIPKFMDVIACHVKKFLSWFDLKKFPMSILKKLVNPNLRDYDWSYWYYMENYSGRLSDPFCSEMFLCKKLLEIAPFQDWVFSQNSMENIIIGCLAYEIPFGSHVLITPSCESKEKIISKLQDFIQSDKHSWESLLKYGITYNSLVSKMDVFNDISMQPIRIKCWKQNRIPYHLNLENCEPWYIPTRYVTKISLKTEICYSIGYYCIRGIRVVTYDGSVIAFGMTKDDEENVETFVIPRNSFIRRVEVVDDEFDDIGLYVHSLGFEVSQPNIGNRGQTRNLEILKTNDEDRDFLSTKMCPSDDQKYFRDAKHYYLSHIRHDGNLRIFCTVWKNEKFNLI